MLSSPDQAPEEAGCEGRGCGRENLFQVHVHSHILTCLGGLVVGPHQSEENSQDLSRDTPERYSPLVLVLVGDGGGEDQWEDEEDDEYSVEVNHVGSWEDQERLTKIGCRELRDNNIQSTVNKGSRGPLAMKVKFLCRVKGFGGCIIYHLLAINLI